MSAKDRYHDCVKNALVKDGWVITHDPLRLSWGGKDRYVDLGATQLLAAGSGRACRIAVEIKSFLGDSEIDDLEKRTGPVCALTRPCYPRGSRIGSLSSRCPKSTKA